ncbi:MAG: divalent metal cation transporter [Pseudomonadota bacterium]|nr:divalent metal cation transporter [Pseudomonadota bacterium]
MRTDGYPTARVVEGSSGPRTVEPYPGTSKDFPKCTEDIGSRQEPAVSDVSEISRVPVAQSSALDDAHIGDIRGALGTLRQGDVAPRLTWRHRLTTLFAILGPGLIVMVGDNDAGAFSTYTQAGQNYGTSLLWTLAILIPVLYVNQEMVLRLGAVSRVGHARLILERFGKFWGAFSVIDLLILNALTIVTEFIGVSLGLDYLGMPKSWGVGAAALLIMTAVSTGNFRRFEVFALALVVGSMILMPIFFMAHPLWSVMTHDFLIPGLPKNAVLADVMLLIIAVVGTTVAPWQLFFQQSYVIDKRITTRFVPYERVDLVFGIVIVIAAAAAMMAFCASAFTGHPEFGQFKDAGAVAAGLHEYISPVAGVFFALALIDASLIGAAAVSLSTAYAVGDVLSVKHSLHRRPGQAKLFYLVYFGLIGGAAALVMIPGAPLGLLTNAVQTLAGVLLPSATVFLLLLCNDKAVLGPWVNSRPVNLFTALVIGVLVTMSLILTAAVLFPSMTGQQIEVILSVGGGAALFGTAVALLIGRGEVPTKRGVSAEILHGFQMPPLKNLPPLELSKMNRFWMVVLRGYLIVAVVLVVVRVVQVAASSGGR